MMLSKQVLYSCTRGISRFDPSHIHLSTRVLSSESTKLSSKKDTVHPEPEGKCKTQNTEELFVKHDEQPAVPSKTKTVAQADAELRDRLEQMSGDGGAAGIEYEDGKPVAMKRGVRKNMFRLI